MIPRIIALLLLAITITAVAEEVAEQVDNIVVTGSRATDQQAEIPNTMTVIRLEELEAQNPVSVPDVLRRLPGVHVVQPQLAAAAAPQRHRTLAREREGRQRRDEQHGSAGRRHRSMESAAPRPVFTRIRRRRLRYTVSPREKR